jgi:hypothetical protein
MTTKFDFRTNITCAQFFLVILLTTKMASKKAGLPEGQIKLFLKPFYPVASVLYSVI